MKNYEEEFDNIWTLYPNKQGKARAFQCYVKSRKKGTTYEQVMDGLTRYLKYCEREKKWYRAKMGSTWFNQECWLDEIDEGVVQDQVCKDRFGNIIL